MVGRLILLCRVALVSRATLPTLAMSIAISVCSFVCSCKSANSTPAKIDVDADPVALLPAGPIVVARIDGRAAAASAGLGPALAELGTSESPLGDEVGFQPSRDVNRIVVGLYGGASVDWVAVLGGRFDTDKLAAATRTKGGSPIVSGTYAGFATHTAGATVYVPLTRQTVLAGSAAGVQRALNRISDSHAGPLVPPWMSEAVATPGAQLVLVGDFQTEPEAAAALASLNVAWTQHLEVARIIANFQPPGLNAAATLTYSSDAEAAVASDGIQSLGVWVRTLGPLLGGIRVQGLEVKQAAHDVQVAFALDDGSLRALAALATRFVPTPAR